MVLLSQYCLRVVEVANITIGEPIQIEMSDDERESYLRMYANKHFRPESIQVIQDCLGVGDDIHAAFSQGAINEMVIEAIEHAIASEHTIQGTNNGKDT